MTTPTTKLVVLSDWQKVRERFSQPERDALNAALVGQMICPKAGIVDVDKLDPALLLKLDTEMAQVAQSTARGRKGAVR